jgi:hypothetical protein
VPWEEIRKGGFMADTGMERIIDNLKEEARRIRALENEAGQALYEQGDESVYRMKLQKKTELLIELPVTIQEQISELASEKEEEIARRLRRFAASAKRAQELSSIFYMSALLYPADYREGEPNDLESFIAGLEEERRRKACT